MPAVMPKVLYLSHATGDVYDIIRAAAPAGLELVTLESNDDAERKRRVRECEVVIAASYPLRRDVIDCADRLRLVHHQGVGYQDTLDLAALQARGIPVAFTPEGTTVGVAEHTVLLMLAVVKLLPFADSELRAGRFHINALRPASRELAGMTIGYVGMGRIGRATAERLRSFGTTASITTRPCGSRPTRRSRSVPAPPVWTSCSGRRTSSRCTYRSPRRRGT
jgi:phosphoglycerate dehydrogenase-like enzyme